MKFDGLKPVLEIDLSNLSKTVELGFIQAISFSYPNLKIIFSPIISFVFICLLGLFILSIILR